MLPMRFAYLLLLFTVTSQVAQGQSIVGDTIFGSSAGFGNVLNYADNGDYVIVGTPAKSTNGFESGEATVYRFTGSAWMPCYEPSDRTAARRSVRQPPLPRPSFAYPGGSGNAINWQINPPIRAKVTTQ